MPQDIAKPPIVATPRPGSYLITGLPRTRSAWLAALLSSDDFPCFHEHVPFTAQKRAFGLCDPGAACCYPNAALNLWAERKVVIVVRNDDEAQRSLKAWLGVQHLPNWSTVLNAYRYFLSEATAPFLVHYQQLADPNAVAVLYQRLIGRELTDERWHLFEGLNVQQHLPMAQARAA